MAFSTFFDFAVLVLLKTARTERDRVIKLNARPDLRCFTNDYAGTVIDEKVFADFRAWVNVDPGAAVSPFGHDAWNQRHFVVKEMRHSINGNRFKNSLKTSSAFASVVSSGGILPRLLQISVFNRACKCRTRIRVVSARSSELTSASLRKPGNIKLISSAHAASMARREGSVAAASR